MSQDIIPVNSEEQASDEIAGLSLSTSLQRELHLGSQDVKDRIIIEMGAEIDNLETCVQGLIKHSAKAPVSSRRFSALKELWSILVERDEKKLAQSKVEVIAGMMLQMKEVMRESGLGPEQVETVLQALAQRIGESEKERSTRKRKETE